MTKLIKQKSKNENKMVSIQMKSIQFKWNEMKLNWIALNWFKTSFGIAYNSLQLIIKICKLII